VRRSSPALGALIVAFVVGTALSGVSGAAAGGTGGLPSPKADNAAPVLPASASVARVRMWLATALSVRLDALGALTAAVGAARDLTAGHRIALDAIVTTDRSGLTGLSAALGSETTIGELQTTASAMVLNYRVFSLLVPEVRAVITADRELAQAVKLSALEPSIQTAITTEQRTGNRAAAAQRIYEALVALLSAVEASTGEVAASLLALTPANDAQVATTLAASTSALNAADAQLVSAQTDIRRIVRILGGA